MRRSLTPVLLALALAGCTSLGGFDRNDIVGACRNYSAVVVVIKLAAFVHPAMQLAVNAITSKVDPICDAVLTGQGAPAGIDAVWIAQRTNELEAIEK